MQEYSKRSKNGHAGEYFAAFKFTQIFGWPYRMLDVDIGVDAEIEILDDRRISTSNLIKLQIKTFDAISPAESKKIYVSDEHITYWKKFCLPIVVVCVDLKAEKIYWKPVIATEIYKTGGQSTIISIDLEADELTLASMDQFKKLAIPDESKEIEPLLESAREQHTRIIDYSTYGIDGEQLDRIEKAVSEFNDTVSRFEEIVKHFPYRAGILTLREIAVMKRNVQITKNDADHSYSVFVNGM